MGLAVAAAGCGQRSVVDQNEQARNAIEQVNALEKMISETTPLGVKDVNPIPGEITTKEMAAQEDRLREEALPDRQTPDQVMERQVREIALPDQALPKKESPDGVKEIVLPHEVTEDALVAKQNALLRSSSAPETPSQEKETEEKGERQPQTAAGAAASEATVPSAAEEMPAKTVTAETPVTFAGTQKKKP